MTNDRLEVQPGGGWGHLYAVHRKSKVVFFDDVITGTVSVCHQLTFLYLIQDTLIHMCFLTTHHD